MQDAIDFVNGHAAKAGRAAGAQGHFELQARHSLAAGQRANEAFGLMRQIVKRSLQDLQPALEICSVPRRVGLFILRRLAAP